MLGMQIRVHCGPALEQRQPAAGLSRLPLLLQACNVGALGSTGCAQDHFFKRRQVVVRRERAVVSLTLISVFLLEAQ